MTARRAATAALLLLAAAACAPVDALNAITPDEGTGRIDDLAYAEGPRGRLDLYLPPGGVAADTPLLVFFYGGGWRSGAKEEYRFLGQAFAARGYLTAIPDYRLVPEGRYPGFVQDGAAAVAALPGLLAAHGIASGIAPGLTTPGRPVIVAGHSAGAHLAAMLALDPRWLGAHGLSPCRDIAALLGLAGPYAILPSGARTVVAAFGPAPQPPDADPIAHAGPAAPATVLLTGAADAVVSPQNSHTLAAALAAAGRPAALRAYEGIGHIDIVAAIAAPLRHVAPTLDDADTLLRAALAAPRPACG